jgi:hypothetical protein
MQYRLKFSNGKPVFGLEDPARSPELETGQFDDFPLDVREELGPEDYGYEPINELDPTFGNGRLLDKPVPESVDYDNLSSSKLGHKITDYYSATLDEKDNGDRKPYYQDLADLPEYIKIIKRTKFSSAEGTKTNEITDQPPTVNQENLRLLRPYSDTRGEAKDRLDGEVGDGSFFQIEPISGHRRFPFRNYLRLIAKRRFPIAYDGSWAEHDIDAHLPIAKELHPGLVDIVQTAAQRAVRLLETRPSELSSRIIANRIDVFVADIGVHNTERIIAFIESTIDPKSEEYKKFMADAERLAILQRRIRENRVARFLSSRFPYQSPNESQAREQYKMTDELNSLIASRRQ